MKPAKEWAEDAWECYSEERWGTCIECCTRVIAAAQAEALEEAARYMDRRASEIEASARTSTGILMARIYHDEAAAIRALAKEAAKP